MCPCPRPAGSPSSRLGGRRAASPCARSSEEVDLVSLILEAVGQIPRGKVSTYGDIARALGDVRAAKAVAQVLWEDESSGAPRHRVVSVEGEIGCGEAFSQLDAKRSLKAEGVHAKGGRIERLDAVRFQDFRLEPVLERLRAEQEDLRSSVVESDDDGEHSSVSGLDASYSKGMGCVAMVRMDLATLQVVETRTAVAPVRFPYITGYLAYRELPLIRRVHRASDGDVLLIDGQGVLHPRGFGIACQVGVSLDAATIGAAKSHLVGEVGQGDRAEVRVDGKVRGMRLRGRGGRGVFVSVGHRVSLESACALCERLMVTRLPEPLRLAHMLATKGRKEMVMNG